MIVLEILLAILGLVSLLPTGYLALLALSARVPGPPKPGRRERRFDLVVPAHDEAAGLSATLESLSATDYPPTRRRIVVVADNCTDETASVARRHGAMVLERCDPSRRGKGYALSHAFATLSADGFADAFVVVDADTLVDANLLAAFDAHLEAGALALQADYGVRNPEDGWRTRLLTLAFALFHRVRSLGRARLGVSAGLRGNGMCLSTEALRRVPYTAHSLVEDIEYGIALGRAGITVDFVPEARVVGEMPATGASSRSQRTRWEKGRLDLARRRLPRLLAEAIRARSRVRLDLALDLAIPPLADLALFVGLGAILSVAVTIAGARPLVGASAFALALVFLAVYLGEGVRFSGMGLRGLYALAAAPIYLGWKLAGGRDLSRRPARWVRTERKETPR